MLNEEFGNPIFENWWYGNYGTCFRRCFLSASFVGSFSRLFFSALFPLPFLLFFILKRKKKAGGENHKRKSAPEKYKATTLPPVPVCSGAFYVPFWLIEKKNHILNSGTSLWKWEPYVEKRNHFYMWKYGTIYWKQVPSVEKRYHF